MLERITSNCPPPPPWAVLLSGVPHHVLPLQWTELPTSGTQRRARKARYQALVDFCVQHGVGTLLLGHHRDDQIGGQASTSGSRGFCIAIIMYGVCGVFVETFLHRLSNESGLKGLACMEGMFLVPPPPSVRVVRPMLDVTKVSPLT